MGTTTISDSQGNTGSGNPVTERAIWKDDWDAARNAFVAWWAGKGLALSITAPKDEPWEAAPEPEPPQSLEQQWLDAPHRLSRELWRLSNTYFGGTAFPSFYTNTGPGSLGLYLGAEGRFSKDTVWYEPSINDPDNEPPLRFSPRNIWVEHHTQLLSLARKHASGRYLIGFPDLIENLDTLAQLRGPQTLLMDLVERPEWVERSIGQINLAWLSAYLWLRRQHRLTDCWGGTTWCAFAIWGMGLTAKVQCDLSCTISPAMFRRFVMPALVEQSEWLDNMLYHLDGTQALPQLDNLLSIPQLDAIEWTPQAGLPAGGSPQWYPLYRRIRAAGKSVQAVDVEYEEVEPLIDAVGGDGLMIITSAKSESDARALLRRVGWPGV